ncbi:MAG: hypothetical protein AB7S26_30615 [Sandaracinaceae bacterium]
MGHDEQGVVKIAVDLHAERDLSATHVHSDLWLSVSPDLDQPPRRHRPSEQARTEESISSHAPERVGTDDAVVRLRDRLAQRNRWMRMVHVHDHLRPLIGDRRISLR